MLDRFRGAQPRPGEKLSEANWLAQVFVYWYYVVGVFFAALAVLCLVFRLWLIAGLLFVAVALCFGVGLVTAAMNREGWALRSCMTCGAYLLRPWTVCPRCGGRPQ